MLYDPTRTIQKSIRRVFGCTLLVLLFYATAMAADLTLAWDPVVANDLAGYKLHYGTASHQYSTIDNVGKATTHKVPGLAEGKTWYFAVTALSTKGLESGYSNELSVTIPAATNPNNPTTPPQKTLRSISINGPNTVPGGSSANFTCLASYSDGSTDTVTPSWSTNSGNAQISPAGVLTTTAATSDQTVTLTATYQRRTATLNVTVQKAATKVRLTIQKNGSGQVTTNPTATTYDRGTTVKLHANPDAGWLFDGWAGMVANPESPTTSIILDRDHWITANFLQDQEGESEEELQGVAHYDFAYPDRASLLSDGWDFMARTASGARRNTERTSGAVVSYDQRAHPGVLRIPADAGDLWNNLNNTRNTLSRDLPLNWSNVRLKLSFAPNRNYQQAGLLVYQDDDNYVQVSRTFDNRNSVTFTYENKGSARNIKSVPQNATNGIYMELKREPGQNVITGSYSLDGANWITLGNVNQLIKNPRLAIVVGASPGGFPNADLEEVHVVTDHD